MVQIEEKPVVVPAPRTRAGSNDCPRCSAHLLFEGDHLACLMCGYEHRALLVHRPGPRHAGDLLDALPEFRAELAGYTDSMGRTPAPGSPGRRELDRASETEAEALESARAAACQSLVTSGHCLIALARGLEPPAPEYGTWPLLQGVLHAAGMAVWLLGSDANRKERIRRAQAMQARDLEAEHAVMRGTIERTPAAAEFLSDALTENAHRRHAVQGTADIEILPGTEAFARLLDAEHEYRLVSSVAQGRPWALRHVTDTALAPEAEWAGAALLVQVHAAASWHAHAVWAYASWMCGTASEELCDLLELGYDSLLLPQTPEIRFWRLRSA